MSDADNALMNTYPPSPVTFVRGDGTELWDSEGNRYLDFLSGLGVTSLGHAHPALKDAMRRQADELWHVSNLFNNEIGPKLAAKINQLLGGNGRVFFANSGAEANECAIKLARKHGGGERYAVVSALESFHGRTLATLHATGQPAKHAAFQPLPEGFLHVPYNDISALENSLRNGNIAGLLLESVQGEGGVNVADFDYLCAARQLCDKYGVLLMMDEVQAGLCRTGRWFGFEHSGIKPDVVTLAKALGNGMPIGACWARSDVAESFVVGDHGTTFGGQPLASAVALATLEVMDREGVPSRAAWAGDRLRNGLEKIPGVASVRGLGLLLAAELEGAEAKAMAAALLTAGLIANPVTPTALRFEPPLLVTDAEIDEALEIIATTLAGA